MARVTITINMVKEDFESGREEFVVHTSPNMVYDENYEYFRNKVDAHIAAEDGKGELEAAGYTVGVVWRCRRPDCRAR